MKRLFIIGNGFDLAHGMKTSYNDFKAYLESKYNCHAKETFDIPGYNCPEDKSTIATFILDFFSKNGNNIQHWNDIEDVMGRNILIMEEYLYRYNIIDDIYSKFFALGALSACVELIPIYFTEWVNSITTENVKIKDGFRKLFNSEDDIFLSFNYTNTLEDIYKVKKVCHIHGIQHEKIVFGHGIQIGLSVEYDLMTDLDCALFDVFKSLEKNTDVIINNNKSFFKELYEIDEIYTYGFSFSYPDLSYIKEICRYTTKKTIWYFSDYNSKEEIAEFQRIVSENGFKGTMRLFSIE